MSKKDDKQAKQYSAAKKVMGMFREIGMKPDEAMTVIMIMIYNDIHRIAEKLAGKIE